MEIGIASILTALAAIFIIMDPFSSVPVFLSMTKRMKTRERHHSALVASSVALGVVAAFLLFGNPLLSVLGISMKSFQIAGGILLLIIAISFVLGLRLGERKPTSMEAVIIGVPLLSGPGVILTSLLLSEQLGLANVLIAGFISCFLAYLTLIASEKINRLIGNNGLEILSRIVGVVLAALGVEFIRRGLGL